MTRMNKLKTAVIFPGIGYHTDKPLLYYSKKLAAWAGFEILEVPYGNFKPGIKGDAEKMREAFESALRQTGEILKDVRWEERGEILFFSKSIGTCVAAAYAADRDLPARHVYYTPLKETFALAPAGTGIAFHGTADPWAADEDIERGCMEKNIPLTVVPDANHSLETGDALTDIKNLKKVIKITRRWIETAYTSI